MAERTDHRRRVRRSAEDWSSLIASQAGSGVSIASFCRGRGLAVSSFYHWRRRLGDGRGAGAAGPGFVRLKLAADGRDDAESSAGGVDDDAVRRAGPVVVRSGGFGMKTISRCSSRASCSATPTPAMTPRAGCSIAAGRGG